MRSSASKPIKRGIREHHLQLVEAARLAHEDESRCRARLTLRLADLARHLLMSPVDWSAAYCRCVDGPVNHLGGGDGVGILRALREFPTGSYRLPSHKIL
jgi:hypothetical protein